MGHPGVIDGQRAAEVVPDVVAGLNHYWRKRAFSSGAQVFVQLGEAGGPVDSKVRCAAGVLNVSNHLILSELQVSILACRT
jgi:hypothetical protein